MQAYMIVPACLFGVWLTIADWASIETVQKNGRNAGLAVWCLTALVPLVVMAYYQLPIAIGGALVGVVLSGAAYWLQQQDKKVENGEAPSFLTRIL